MTLVSNGARDGGNPVTWFGGTTTVTIGHQVHSERGLKPGPGGMRNRHSGEGGILPAAGVPYGYEGAGCWSLPMVGGGLAAFTTVLSDGGIAGPLTMARKMSAEMVSDGGIAGNMKLLVQLAAEMIGDCAVTADLKAIANLSAEMAGAGEIAGSMRLIAFCVAEMTADGGLDTSNLTGIAHMDAEMTSTGDVLTAGQVAAAVWEELAAAHDSAGTMGEKLNDAGSAANPWTEVIESGYTAEELLRLIAAAELGKLTVTPGSVIIRDVNDTTDRITATVDEDGNRIDVSLDPS